MKKMRLLCFLSCLTIISCTSLNMAPHAQVNDHLNAELYLMKKNLNLVMAENEVVKTENDQYRSEIKKLKNAISGLNDDLKSLNREYMDYKTRMTENYETVISHFNLFKENSEAQIGTLKANHLKTSKEYAANVSNLKELMKKNREDCSARQASLEKQYETKLQELEKQLTASGEQLAKRERMIEAMQTEKNTAQKKITDLENEINKLTHIKISQTAENPSFITSSNTPEAQPPSVKAGTLPATIEK